MIRKLKIKALLLVVILFAANIVKSQTEPVLDSVLKGSEGKLVQGAQAFVKDIVFFDPVLKPTILFTNKVSNVITFRIDEYSTRLLPDSFKADAQVRVIFIDKDNQKDSIEKTLTINYNKKKTYTNKSHFYFNNAHEVNVKVLSLTAQYAPLDSILPVLDIENQMIIDRDYKMDCSIHSIKTIAGDATNINVTGELLVSWASTQVAEEYDLEWTYVDKSALESGRYNTSGQLNPALLFKFNASRVTVATDNYAIPMLYDGDGMLYFRVRGAQFLPDGRRVTTPWSSDFIADGGLGEYDFDGHEKKLNWQSSTSFAEEGKRKTVVQYFDGSLKGRQTVTKDNTTGTTVVAETLYDKQGRPVIQILPAPTLSSLIQFTPRFNTDINGVEYDKGLYDTVLTESDYCAEGAPEMSADTGTAKYYSPNNPLKTEGYHQYIPNAYGFAFTETRYSQDNTGRITKQSGVGKEFRIGSGKETKYYDGTPDQKELDALFGTEAGDFSHYQKNMVRDANGQYSVSYVDMHGRTVATALAGEPPATLQALNSYNYETVTSKLLNKTNNVITGTAIESVNSIVVTRNGSHQFNYQLSPQSLQLENCESNTICYDCLYDLEITVTDDCNNQNMPGDTAFRHITRNFSFGSIDTTCSSAQAFTVNFTLPLPEGAYTVTKRLSINQEAMQYYRDSVFLAQNTCKTYEDIVNEQRIIIGEQLGNCAPDTIAIKDYENLRQQMLYDLTPPSGQYANPDSVLKGFSIFNREGFSKYLFQSNEYVYKDEEGNNVVVQIERQGEVLLVNPNKLNRDEFIDNFQPSWAEALLSAHPEYKLWQAYEKLNSSHIWDEDFEKTDTYSEAVAKGYLNPTASSSSPASRFTSGSDPLFTDLNTAFGSFSANAARQSINDSLFLYKSGGGTTITAWGLSTIFAKCPDAQVIDGTCATTWNNNDNVFSNTLCEGELNMAWRFFRGSYLEIKKQWIDNFIRTQAPGLSYPADFGFIPVFPTMERMMQEAGYADIYGDPAQHVTTAKAKLAETINASCEDFAKRWIEQLGTCNYSAADLNDIIIPRLIEVCKKGGDSTHPYGASTISPDSTNTFESFDAVIRDYNEGHGITTNVSCNGYLIDLPKAHSQPFIVAEKTQYSKPDSCECARITQLHNEYQAATATYSSFSNFMAVKYKTSISQGSLDTLSNLCNGTITCKFIPQPITIPPTLQCGTGSTCVDCITVKAAYDSFLVRFPGGAPLRIAPDTIQQSINKVFLGYMNGRLGISKSVAEYLDFIDSCYSAIEAPVTACDSLEYIIEQYQQQYINPISGYVDLDIRTFAGNKTPVEGPKGVFDVNGDLIGNTVDGTTEQINQSFAQIWNSSSVNSTIGQLSALPDGRFRLILDSGQIAPCNGIVGQRFYQFESSVYDSLSNGWIFTADGSYIDFGDSTAAFVKGKVYESVVVDGENISTNPRNVITEWNYAWRHGENLSYLSGYTPYKTFRVRHKYHKPLATWNNYTVTVYHTDLKGFVGFLGGRLTVGDPTTSPFKNLRGFIPQQTLHLYYASTQDSTICRTREIRNFTQINSMESFEISNRGAAPFNVNLGSFENNHDIQFLWYTPAINTPAIAGTPFREAFPNLPVNFPKIANMWLEVRESATISNLHLSVYELPKLRQFNVAYLHSYQADSLLNQLARVNNELDGNGRLIGSAGITNASLAAQQKLTGQSWHINGMNATTDEFYLTFYSNVIWDKDSLVRTNAFTEFYNGKKGTNYTYDQLQQLYLQRCGTALNLCSLRNSIDTMPGVMLCGIPQASSTSITFTQADACSDSTQLIAITATEIYKAYRDSIINSFNEAYTQKCLAASAIESFTVSKPVSEYHYTLYYYDQAGNLVKTISPEGVQPNRNATWLAQVDQKRKLGERQVPSHGLATTYRYNSLNQVVTQNSPDGGYNRFWYDRLGRLVVSQNAKQNTAGNYSYIKYDPLGRREELGEKQHDTAMTNTISRNQTLLGDWLNHTYTYNSQTVLAHNVTRTNYDLPATLPIVGGTTASHFHQKEYTLRQRLSSALRYDALLVVGGITQYINYASGTYYSYDVHGNVDTLLQDYRIGVMSAGNGLNKYKLIAYNYDLISGKVNQVHYQPGEKDQFYHRYEYDSENNLTDVYTTTVKDFVGTGDLEEKEAFYQYYKHGPLARIVLGQQQVQGIDYAHTLQGWLKGVNSTGLNPEHDMGNDGKAGSSQEHVARDVYGFNLNYFNGTFTNDYTSINAQDPFPGHSGLLNENHRNLFNGNITSIAMNIKFPGQAENVVRGAQLYNYKYDQLNRLVAMDLYRGFNSTDNQWKNPINAVADYKERVSYDANGNILSYLRNGSIVGGKPLAMDSLNYKYFTDGNGNKRNNRLRLVEDDVVETNYTEDIDDQRPLMTNTADSNYVYDEIGNLIRDKVGKIDNIKWNVYGKIEEIVKTPTAENPVSKITYTYDAAGNRISKKVDKQGASSETTWYVRDASGNVMAVYSSKDVLKLNEQHVYGSSRLGIVNRDIPVADPTVTGENNNLLGTTYLHSFERGKKFFELVNHLGNVLVTVSDRKLQITGNGGDESNGNCEAGTAEDVLNVTVRINESSYVAQTEVNLMPGFDSEVGDDYAAYTDATLGDCIEHTAPPVGTEGWYYAADIISANDYFPFGMQMPGRKYDGNGGYRYSINGQEKEKELNDNITSAEFWMYDSRIGRRWNVDPVVKEYESPYATFSNNPIIFVDPLGLDSDDPRYKELSNVTVVGIRKRKEGDKRTSYRELTIKDPIKNLGVLHRFQTATRTIKIPVNETFHEGSEYFERGWYNDHYDFLMGGPTAYETTQFDWGNGQVMAEMSWRDYAIGLYEGSLGPGRTRDWNGFAVDSRGYLTKELFDPGPLLAKGPSLKKLAPSLFRKGSYTVYFGYKKGLLYVGKALNGIKARYKGKIMPKQLQEALENIPNNGIALGIEQIAMKLNGWKGKVANKKNPKLSNINNATVNEIYEKAALKYLNENVKDWQILLKKPNKLK